MGISAGRLRHRIRIEERVDTRDEEGGVEEDWVLFKDSVPAEVVPITGAEKQVAGTLIGQATARIVIRARPGLSANMRAIHNGTIYSILAAVPDPVSGRSYIQLLCNTGANDGQAN